MSLEEIIDRRVEERVRAILPELMPDILYRVQTLLANKERLTTKEAARYIGMSEQWLEIGRTKGNFNVPPHIKAGRKVLYERAALDRWLEERREARR
jgi:hypothetical protein